MIEGPLSHIGVKPQSSSGGFLEPERIVKSLGLEKGDYVADFGSGHGYFAIPAARIVGGEGKVYAIDVQRSMLDVIRGRAKLEHLLNIELVWGNLDEPLGSKLKDNLADFVIIANILFQSESKTTVLNEAYRVLRIGGKVVVIEWDDTPAPLGPPIALRVKKETVMQAALDAGLAFEKEFDAGDHHYGLFFKKNQ